jgi:hypothetical protein
MQTKFVEYTNKKRRGRFTYIESSIPILKIKFYGYRKLILYFDLNVKLRKKDMDWPFFIALHVSKKYYKTCGSIRSPHLYFSFSLRNFTKTLYLIMLEKMKITIVQN